MSAEGLVPPGADFTITIQGPNGTIFMQHFTLVDPPQVQSWLDDAILEHAAAYIKSAVAMRRAYEQEH